MRKYIIIESSEVSNIDFSEVLETSAETLRYSVDGTKTFVKFEGTTPSYLFSRTEYTNSEIREILQTSEENR